jgi:hypothetical protein
MLRYHRRIELEEEDQIALDGGLVLYFLSLYLRRERTNDIVAVMAHFSDWHDHLQSV